MAIEIIKKTRGVMSTPAIPPSIIFTVSLIS